MGDGLSAVRVAMREDGSVVVERCVGCRVDGEFVRHGQLRKMRMELRCDLLVNCGNGSCQDQAMKVRSFLFYLK